MITASSGNPVVSSSNRLKPVSFTSRPVSREPASPLHVPESPAGVDCLPGPWRKLCEGKYVLRWRATVKSCGATSLSPPNDVTSKARHGD
ncbi:hypothetical protein E2C01_069959 [Portunus trituberculatus]|uniref:Uncharacterized protein n=1 Tax=Portunus trituberculatus TaxID=210409 RepID=A0A5B7I0X8_PORTR|nr:hypothetical protein [Portunus trituberculatus]